MAAVRREDIRRAYIAQHRLLTTLVVGSGLLGLFYLFQPHILDQTALGIALEDAPLEFVWNLGLVIGSLLCVLGIYHLRRLLERSGLVILAAVFAVDAVVLIDVRGLDAGSLSASTFLFIAVGCAWRALGR